VDDGVDDAPAATSSTSTPHRDGRGTNDTWRTVRCRRPSREWGIALRRGMRRLRRRNPRGTSGLGGGRGTTARRMRHRDRGGRSSRFRGQRRGSRRLRCREALRCPPRSVSPNMDAKTATRTAKARPTPNEVEGTTGPSASTVWADACAATATRRVSTSPYCSTTAGRRSAPLARIPVRRCSSGVRRRFS
jgi:hypothetical protein